MSDDKKTGSRREISLCGAGESQNRERAFRLMPGPTGPCDPQ